MTSGLISVSHCSLLILPWCPISLCLFGRTLLSQAPTSSTHWAPLITFHGLWSPTFLNSSHKPIPKFCTTWSGSHSNSKILSTSFLCRLCCFWACVWQYIMVMRLGTRSILSVWQSGNRSSRIQNFPLPTYWLPQDTVCTKKNKEVNKQMDTEWYCFLFSRLCFRLNGLCPSYFQWFNQNVFFTHFCFVLKYIVNW